MLKFGKTKVAKESFMVQKDQYDVNNIVISKLVETKNNFKYLIGYLDEVIRQLVLILPKMSRYVKAFKAFKGKVANKDKNHKVMSLRLNDNKLLEKYETVCTKIEYLENIKSDALPVYDDRFIKN